MKKAYLSLFFIVISFFIANAQQYSQSFDSATMPTDWTVINGGDANTWKTWSSYNASNNITPHTGASFLGLEYGSTAHDDYAISPSITVTAGVSDKVTFWAYNGGAGLAEKISVKVSTTTPTAAAFTTSLVTNLKPPTLWTQYSYDLTPYVGQTIYIAFYSNTTDIWFIGIDDFAITSNTLATQEVNAKVQAKTYPNPVDDYLFIEGKGKISDIKVLDYSGKIVKNIDGREEQSIKIYLGDLKNGNYILSFKENGDAKSRKIVKK